MSIMNEKKTPTSNQRKKAQVYFMKVLRKNVLSLGNNRR